MKPELAYFRGEFRPAHELALSVEDLGFVQGVAVSERMRTFGGRLFRVDDHVQRLARSAAMIDVTLECTWEQIGQIAQELASHNASRLDPGDDLGLSLFVTPGVPGGVPTLGMYTYPLPFRQWVSYYAAGQALTETGVRQVPAVCWPLALKCRSRMHYYLADKQAHRIDPGSRAILLDLEGFVSEASTANVLFYRRDEGLISPTLSRILPGVSLSVIDELAAGLGTPMHYRDFRLEELAEADEILLCSTSPCIWPVTRLNGRRAGRGTEGPLFRALLAAWNALIGLDIEDQARRFTARVSR
jgi:branched-subunit amino acid aminotransferase/4-amino-4-deoxychorismate lyase